MFGESTGVVKRCPDVSRLFTCEEEYQAQKPPLEASVCKVESSRDACIWRYPQLPIKVGDRTNNALDPTVVISIQSQICPSFRVFGF